MTVERQDTQWFRCVMQRIRADEGSSSLPREDEVRKWPARRFVETFPETEYLNFVLENGKRFVWDSMYSVKKAHIESVLKTLVEKGETPTINEVFDLVKTKKMVVLVELSSIHAMEACLKYEMTPVCAPTTFGIFISAH